MTIFGSNSRILRLTASTLAVTGLLGHGLAMLLVGFLASPVAAQSEDFYLTEICTADGLVRLADGPSGESGGGSDHRGNPLKSCPVCSAFAQTGPADLPATAVLPPPQCCSAKQRPLHGSATGVSRGLAAQPRAPPALA